MSKQERKMSGVQGWAVVPAILVVGGFCGYKAANVFLQLQTEPQPMALFLWLLAAGLVAVCVLGFFIVNPGEAKVLQLFGSYAGTAKTPGLRWVFPIFSMRRISLRIRNFESTKIKVNEKGGSPIEIASIIGWRVSDTYEAIFQVDDFEQYVHIQAEAAVRNLAMHYPYDAGETEEISLHGSPDKITEHLHRELQERVAKAGVEILEARLSHLAYAQEIAASMLQRQQAGAIIAARRQIVEGAVGMVDLALKSLASSQIVDLDEERKASMVSNLLVVLCSERSTQPVVNAGTIYQ